MSSARAGQLGYSKMNPISVVRAELYGPVPALRSTACTLTKGYAAGPTSSYMMMVSKSLTAADSVHDIRARVARRLNQEPWSPPCPCRRRPANQGPGRLVRENVRLLIAEQIQPPPGRQETQNRPRPDASRFSRISTASSFAHSACRYSTSDAA